jgi:ATP-dependent DNA helicase RecQ
LDVAAAVEECVHGAQVDQVPAQEVLDTLYESANDDRRNGRADALRLITAHGAKGLEFDHVIVMDCGDWKWDGDPNRRLLYVAMTRARQTLTVMRSEVGGNMYLTDIGTVDGVAEGLPAVRPQHRPELDRRYETLGPASVDLGYAGRLVETNPVHASIAQVRVGDPVQVAERQVRNQNGSVLGRLAKKCDLPTHQLSGAVFAIMVRTRAQAAPEYMASVKVDRWEVPLVEVLVQAPP